MIRKSRTKAVLFMMLLVFVGMVTGFFMGAILASAIAKKKENPAFWRETVHKQLGKLHPTPEQRKKLETRTDSAVEELATIKADTIKKVWDVVDRAVGDLDKELTPEQRKTFETFKPKRPAELK